MTATVVIFTAHREVCVSESIRGSPLPAMDHRARRVRVANEVEVAGLAGLYVTDPADLAWLTGFTGSNGAALVGADGRCTVATDARYEGRLEASDDLAVLVDRDLFAPVLRLLAESSGPVAFDPATVTHARALTWIERAGERLVAREGLVATLRRVKDAAEITRLARACAITVAAWEEVVVDAASGGHLEGTTERELAIVIERHMVDLGADDVAFPSIVAAGPNGAVPHHEPTTRPLGGGDLVTTDIGAVVDGYHADFTRTIAVSSRPVDPTLVAAHDLVVRAQRRGVSALVVDEPVVEVDRVAREVIEGGGFGEQFVHGVGHGVGLAIHEDPIIALATTARLVPGMVLTVEPGVYLPGLGGVRVEDTVVVTPAGPRVLTSAPTGIHPVPSARSPT